MTIQDVYNAILGQFGTIVLLLVILWAGWKRIWVFGSYYTEMQKELRQQITVLERRLERTEKVAEYGTGLASRATRLVETQVKSGASSEQSG